MKDVAFYQLSLRSPAKMCMLKKTHVYVNLYHHMPPILKCFCVFVFVFILPTLAGVAYVTYIIQP